MLFRHRSPLTSRSPQLTKAPRRKKRRGRNRTGGSTGDYHTQLGVEHLEDRRLLAVVINAGVGDDAILLSRDGGDTVVSVNGTEEFREPFADIMDGLTINGEAGDDTLTVDFDGGPVIPAGGLMFNGGTDSDNIVLQDGGPFATVTHTFTNENAGAVDISTENLITYAGLEPIADNLNVANRIFTFLTNGITGSLTTSPSIPAMGVAPATHTRIDSGASESVDFTTPSMSMTANTANGANTFTVTSLANDYQAPAAGTLTNTINGGTGVDIVNMEVTDGSDVEGTGVEPWTFDGMLGNDTLNISPSAKLVNSLDDRVTFIGNAGTGDTLNVEDDNNGAGTTYTVTSTTITESTWSGTTGGVTYNQPTTENVNLLDTGAGGDTINVTSTSDQATTAIQSAAGDDTYNITASSLGGTNNFFGNAGNDQFNVNITAAAGISATLNIEGDANDTGDRDEVEIDDTTVARVAINIAYPATGVGDTTVTGLNAAGAGTFTVGTTETIDYNGTGPADTLTVTGTEDNSDLITVAPISGTRALVFNGGNPFDGAPELFGTSLPGIAGGGTLPDLDLEGLVQATGLTINEADANTTTGDRLYVYGQSEVALMDPAATGRFVDPFGFGNNEILNNVPVPSSRDMITVTDTMTQVTANLGAGDALVRVNYDIVDFVQATPNVDPAIIVNAGEETTNPTTLLVDSDSDNITVTPSPDYKFQINGNNPDPASVANGGTEVVPPAGDQLNLAGPFPIVNVFATKPVGGGEPVISLEFPTSGKLPVSFSSIEELDTINAATVNLIGDNNDPDVDQSDTFVVVGRDVDSAAVGGDADGANEFAVTINGNAVPLKFAGVQFLNVSGDDQNPAPGRASVGPNDIDTLSITPYADDTPRGWGIDVSFNEGNPSGTDGNQDLLVYNTTAAPNNDVSEDIVIRPSGPDNGELVVTNGSFGTPIVDIDFGANTDIVIRDNDQSIDDTETLRLLGTNPDTPNASGNDSFLVDLDATQTMNTPLVTVTDSANGAVLYRLRGFQSAAGTNNGVGALGAITAGASYTNGVYNGVALTDGTGTGATANITVAGGLVTAVTVVNVGSGYAVGDMLSADTADIGGGTGFSVSVASLAFATIDSLTFDMLAGNDAMTFFTPTIGNAPTGVFTSGVDQVNVQGGSGDDAVNVDYTGNDPWTGGRLTYDGGAGADSLTFADGTHTALLNAHYTPGPIPGNGRMEHTRAGISGTGIVDFTNLEPTFDFTAAATVTVNADNADNAISYFTDNGVGTLGAITGGAYTNNGVYLNVPLTGGTGTGARADITVAGGTVTGVTLVNDGSGYTIGDNLSAATANLGGAGAGGFSIPVASFSGTVSVDNQEVMVFANKTNLTINALGGSDGISLNNPATPAGLTGITVNGGDPTDSDTVIVNGTAAANSIVVNMLTGDGAVVTGAQPVQVTVDTAEHLTIDGQDGGDSLTYTTPAGRDDITYLPGGSPDSGSITGTDLTAPGISTQFLSLEFADLGDGGTIRLDDFGGSRTDSLQLFGTEIDDTFEVSAAGVLQIETPLLDRTLPISTPGVAAVTLLGLSGDDAFNVPGNHPFTGIAGRGIVVEGGSPSASDVLNLNGAGAAITVDLDTQRISETPFAPVEFSGVEQVNIDAENANLTAQGTSFDDILTYTPTGAETGTFTLEELNTVFNFSDLSTSLFTVDLRDDLADEVVVRGTNNHDVITVDSPNRRVDVENVAGTVLAPVVLANTVETVTTRARLGNDTILVIPAPAVGSGLAINVDGGPPSASDALVLAGSLTRANANSPVTNTTQFNAATDFVVQYRSLLPNEGRLRVFRNATAMPDISYRDVEIVSPLVDPNNNPNSGDPRLLILGPDEYEANEFRATAAFLGSGSTINVPHLAIFPDANEHRFVPADQDYFQVVAQTTGTLDFQVYFRMFLTTLLPAGGNLTIQVLDSDGTVIGGAGTFGNSDPTPDARVRIPAVAGQSYFLHVLGANENVVNGYDLTVINEGPPTPYDLELRDVIDASLVDADVVPSTTQFSGGAGLVTIDDFYNGKDLVFLSGDNIGRRVRIIDYVGATGDFTVQPGVLVDAPTVGDRFQIESDDTGNSQLDNYTRDNTPLIFFRLDDAIYLQDLPGNATPDTPPDEVIPIPFVTPPSAGYRVAVFDNGDSDPDNPDELPQVPVGFARMVDDGIYVFDFDTDALNAPFALSDGSHFLSARVQIIDPATPQQTGWGPRSDSLEIVVDSATPPVFFGDAAVGDDGLHPDSDSHVDGGVQPLNDFDMNQNIETRSDRVTNETTPSFWGMAEADSTVRLYLDMNNNNLLELDTDLLLGLTVAVPDGTNQFPFGQWNFTTNIDLDRADIVTALNRFDGLRTVYATAEDAAGNITDPVDAQRLNIFLDTQGPQITNVRIDGFPGYNLFGPKPSDNGFTPLVDALTISVRDLPDRSNADLNFRYQALVENIAENPGNYAVVGDHVGFVDIESAVWTPDPFPAVDGDPGRGTITLNFANPLPDDRFTFTIFDNLVDPAGNRLDGESGADEPDEDPDFPSGDGVPGGNFVARFTVDSRPEIGSFVAQNIDLDINGNFVWDPANGQIGNDATNVDLSFTLPVAGALGATGLGGYNVHDLVFAGKFSTAAAPTPPRLFDQLAAYGWSAELGLRRWLIDTNSNGVITPGPGSSVPAVAGGTDILTFQPDIAGFNVAGAIPVAGDFNDGAGGGPDGRDEIGLYYAGRWAFDTNGDFIIQPGELLPQGNLLGHPIVGDFDGDGDDDLGVFNNNQFSFSLDGNVFQDPANILTWGFPGVLDRPVAADMDQDGVDDIGLWIPRNSAQSDRPIAEWYFLLSGGNVPIAGTINTLDHPFTPVPFGADLYAEFGDELALPIVGNFDPPVTQQPDPDDQNVEESADFDTDGDTDGFDFLAWQRGFGTANGAASPADGDADADGSVNGDDLSAWQTGFGTVTTSQTTSAGEPDLAQWQANFGVESGSLPVAGDADADGDVDGFDFLAWQRGYNPAPLVSAASIAIEPAFVSSLGSETAALTAQPLSAELVDAAIAMDQTLQLKPGSRFRSHATLQDDNFDWISRRARWGQSPVWQGTGEIADHSFRGQINKVNDGRFHRDADAVDEALLDELFAEGELLKLL